MATARSSPIVTSLQNGKALVIGGNDSNFTYLSSAELYDSVNNTWSSAGSMVQPRNGITPILLSNGKVLVAGGFYQDGATATTLSSAELYDPENNTWSSAGSMGQPRNNSTPILLSNGKVLMVGGRDWVGNSATNTYLSSAELYDPDSNTWSDAGNMAQPRNTLPILLSNGKVLVAGGNDGPTNTSFSSAELYDSDSNTWISAGNMAQPRSTAKLTLLQSGKVLVIGGVDSAPNSALVSAELYDPDSNTWSSANSMVQSSA